MKKLKTVLVAALAALMISCTGMQKPMPVFNVFGSIRAVDEYNELFDKIEKENIEHFVLDIHNPGASAFALTYIINRMNALKEKGVIIETHVESMALSGGFVIFINGTRGYRRTAKNALFLMHSLQVGGMFGSIPIIKLIKQPDRFLMKTYVQSIVDGTGLSYKRIEEMLLTGEEFWLTGELMIEKGWADKEL